MLAPLLLEVRRRALAARRGGRTRMFLVLTAIAAVLQVVAISWIVGFAVLLWQVGVGWLGAAYLGLVAIGYLPWTVARGVAVPLGRPRLAYHVGGMAREAKDDPVGVSLILAGWALCRQREVDADDAAWIERQRDARGRTGDARVIATALVAEARGDRAAARSLIESVAWMPEVTPIARELAGEWLAVDDAGRGEWRRILARAPRRAHAQLVVDPGELGLPDEVAAVKRPAAAKPAQVWPATPLTYFLEGVAARLVGEPDAPSDRELFVRWCEAPRRRHTWTLYRRAIAPRPAPAPSPEPATVEPPSDPIAAHVAAIQDPSQVTAAAAAWDRALSSPDFRARVLARAIDVGAPPDAGHKVLDDLARAAGDELATLILASEVCVDSLRGGGVLDAAVQRVRHRLLGELELAISRTSERVRARRELPAIDEWRELVALRAAHVRASRLGGAELRRLAFPHLHEALTPWLVWLWNERHEHAISDALTCWLLAEALAVGDAQAIETHGKNASLPLPARG